MYATVPIEVPGLVSCAVSTPTVSMELPLRRRHFRIRHLRQPEIEDLHMTALRDENVRRLDVAVDDSFAVCGVQRIRH